MDTMGLFDTGNHDSNRKCQLKFCYRCAVEKKIGDRERNAQAANVMMDFMHSEDVASFKRVESNMTDIVKDTKKYRLLEKQKSFERNNWLNCTFYCI